jgi:hypothetical protein
VSWPARFNYLQRLFFCEATLSKNAIILFVTPVIVIALVGTYHYNMESGRDRVFLAVLGLLAALVMYTCAYFSVSHIRFLDPYLEWIFGPEILMLIGLAWPASICKVCIFWIIFVCVCKNQA